ncbi:hypothetical protein VPH35_136727 [Triticum aestivum]
MSFIPTRRTYWKLPRGAGRVEEMEGFSLPDRRVAPPPGATRYDLLIHVDRIKDWTLCSSRSSHSVQSGLPSSGSNDDDALPRTHLGTWTMHVEDGQREEPHRRQARAPVVDTGCRGMPLGGSRRDPDNDGAGRSWKDTLLGRGHGHQAQAEITSREHRVRSRSPPMSHRSGSSKGSEALNDNLDQFFAKAKKPITATGPASADAAHLNAEIEAALASPLEFSDMEKRPEEDALTAVPDIFGPTLSRPTHNPASFNCSTPTAATMAAQNNTTPVAERATLRLVKGLGLLGPKEKMMAKAADALIRRFDEPLSDDDINVIAKLTRLNKEALRVAVGMAGPGADPEEVVV